MNKKTTVQACPVLVRVSEPGSNTGMHAELAICKRREREHVNVSSLLFFSIRNHRLLRRREQSKATAYLSIYMKPFLQCVM